MHPSCTSRATYFQRDSMPKREVTKWQQRSYKHFDFSTLFQRQYKSILARRAAIEASISSSVNVKFAFNSCASAADDIKNSIHHVTVYITRWSEVLNCRNRSLSSFLVSEFANCCWDGKYQSVANLGRIEKNTSPHCSMLWIVHTMVPKFITSALAVV